MAFWEKKTLKSGQEKRGDVKYLGLLEGAVGKNWLRETGQQEISWPSGRAVGKSGPRETGKREISWPAYSEKRQMLAKINEQVGYILAKGSTEALENYLNKEAIDRV